MVKNITPDGMLLETNVKLVQNDLLQLSFTLPNTHKSVNAESKVRWVETKKAWSIAGLEFIDQSAEQRDVIMEYRLTLGISI